MTQTEHLLKLFEERGGRMTLGEIMQTPLGCEYRARMTELRKKGYTVTCEMKRPASQNLYRIEAPKSYQYFQNQGYFGI